MSAPGKLVRSSRWKTGPSKGQRPLGSECCVTTGDSHMCRSPIFAPCLRVPALPDGAKQCMQQQLKPHRSPACSMPATSRSASPGSPISIVVRLSAHGATICDSSSPMRHMPSKTYANWFAVSSIAARFLTSIFGRTTTPSGSSDGTGNGARGRRVRIRAFPVEKRRCLGRVLRLQCGLRQ
jgi:hypothetical protein